MDTNKRNPFLSIARKLVIAAIIPIAFKAIRELVPALKVPALAMEVITLAFEIFAEEMESEA